MNLFRYLVRKCLRTTSGFTQAGVYARRQFCVDLEVYRPPEPLWNPRLREAAGRCMQADSKIFGRLDFAKLDSFACWQTTCRIVKLEK